MSSRLPLLLSALVAAALAGCSTEVETRTTDKDLTEDQSAAASAKTPTKLTGAAEGEACGGKAAVECAPGLECKLSDASKADSAGTCIAGVVTCLAMPSCDLGHEPVENEAACAKGAGAVCYKRALCNKTIWCSADLAPAK